jgi:hypothetical protein
MAGGRALIPKNAFGWPILAVSLYARVGLLFASLIFWVEVRGLSLVLFSNFYFLISNFYFLVGR